MDFAAGLAPVARPRAAIAAIRLRHAEIRRGPGSFFFRILPGTALMGPVDCAAIAAA